MAVSGSVREATLSLLESPPHRVARERAPALLAAIEWLQEGAEPREMTERAALAVVSLTTAAFAMVYFEGSGLEPQLFALGALDETAAEACSTMLRGLISSGAGSPYLLFAQGATLIAPFGDDLVRGGILARKSFGAFDDADGRMLAQLARQVGCAATMLCLRERVRGMKQVDAAALDAVNEPSQVAVEGRMKRASQPPSRLSPTQKMFGLDDLVGESAALRQVRELALVATRSDSSLLIEGETGVGKEVLAQAIHSGGPRHRGPFIAVHCAAIPRDLLESELFGYDRGAFTGADPHGHAGKFELGRGGTLLLDDVADLPLEMQAKLLRVLQERSVTRLGGSRSRPVDVRVVATSNVPLRRAMEAGRFRADLFYRLSVLSIPVPPLRERREDLRPLAEHFLRKYSPLHGRRIQTVCGEALRAIESYPWPGNVRELEHWMESEVHFASPSAVSLERLARLPTSGEQPAAAPAVRSLREVERELCAAAIAASGGDVTRAARDLGISRGRLYRKLRLYGLEPR